MAATPAGACATPADARALPDWVEARAPGTVAQALEAAGLWRRDQPTPLHDQDFWWRLPLPSTGPQRLRLEGLATFAEVWIDVAPLLVSSSMFAPAEAEVQIAPGAELWICFRALTPKLSGKGPRARWRPRMIEHQGLRLVRTTLLGHMPGWCPSVDIVGPWRPISLTATEALHSSDLRLQTDWTGASGRLLADLRLSGALGEVVLACGDAEAAMTPTPDGRLKVELEVSSAEPWWPHTHGPQPLYPVTVRAGGQTLELGRVGFRRLEVDRGLDGEGFALRLNGEAVFCRGAAWITPDLVALSSGREAYEPTLRTARDAGFNMVRVSGVGVYESADFFRVCDELGLLVWQDFMFANFDYPAADPAFRELVRAEAAAVLAGTQGSPSLAVLCGGSEVMQQAAMMGLDPAALDWSLFETVLADVARDLRPDAAFVPNTPCGGAMPFQADKGVTHYYGVGAYERPLEDARRTGVRFAAECLAFANVPQPQTLARGLNAPAVHDPRWKARVPRDRGASWDFEDVRDHYLQRLFGADPYRLRREDPDLYLDLSRVVSGEAMAAVFSEWRRAGSGCGGGLVWTLRDLEIGAGWGLIDADGESKPALHVLRRVLQPVQVLLTDEGVNGLAVHLMNETGAAWSGELRLAAFGDEPGALIDVRREVMLAPRSATTLSGFELVGRFFDLNYAYRFGPRAHQMVLAELRHGEELESQALHVLPGTPRAGAGAVETRVEPDGQGWRLTLRAERLQPYVHVADAAFAPQDDWFPLAPGEPRTVRLSGRQGAAGSGEPQGEILGLGGRVLGAYG
ncbi:glycoside hydrolase family 2 protein [Phenylobacterium deserti]|nr:glycoside hydrolase family 2 protein [Phenylobacterium deserti]